MLPRINKGPLPLPLHDKAYLPSHYITVTQFQYILIISIVSFLFSILFYFTDIKFYIYLCTLICVYILLSLSSFGYSQYILLLSIIPSSFYHNQLVICIIHKNTTCITHVIHMWHISLCKGWYYKVGALYSLKIHPLWG